MRRMIELAAVGAAMVLALTGCAGTTDGPLEAAGPARQGEPTETVAPLTAEAPSEDAESQAPSSPDSAFLAEVRPYVAASTQIPDATDQQLLAAGEDACAQIAGGTLPDKVRVIQDEQPDELGYYVDSGRIGYFAAEFLCA